MPKVRKTRDPSAATTVDLPALFARADGLMDAGLRRRAFRLFLLGARGGDLDCIDRVGVHLSSGQGARRDSTAALRWLRRAHRLGSTVAANNIAVTYAELGRWELAVRWWTKVVAAGDVEGHLDLAMCLLEGRGIRRDAARARRLLERMLRSSRSRSITEWSREWALALLGVMCASAIGGRRDLRKGRRLIERASRDGAYPEAQRVLADLDEARLPAPLDVARSGVWRTMVTARRRRATGAGRNHD